MARGEFSIILASFAVPAGLSHQLPSIAALYVLVIAFISPVLAKKSKNIYEFYESIIKIINERSKTTGSRAG